MHADRFRENMKTVESTIMNRKALLPLGPFQIVSKFKEKPVAFVFGFKSGTYSYDLYTSQPFYSKGLSIDELVEKYAKAIEEKIRKYPLHWFNFYYFWNKN